MIVVVDVYLDDEVPEYMDGLIRCGEVLSRNEEGEETNHQELIDNAEYSSVEELIADIAQRLEVSPDIVEIVDDRVDDGLIPGTPFPRSSSQ